MTRTFLTSDLHLGHRHVAAHRGFGADVIEHDRTILSNIASTLDAGDNLWILGDISSGTNKSEGLALQALRDLAQVFPLHLVAGNHDAVHPLHRDAHSKAPHWLKIFQSVQPFARRRVNGRNVWLSHFPYFGAGDRGDVERYPETRLHDNGEDWLLHGHLHCPEKLTGPRSIHIGLDAWNLMPVPLTTIEAMIPDKETT